MRIQTLTTLALAATMLTACGTAANRLATPQGATKVQAATTLRPVSNNVGRVAKNVGRVGKNVGRVGKNFSFLPGVTTREPSLLPVLTAAPKFAMTALDGKEDALANYAGKAVLLVWWATWCPTCTEEMPMLNAMHDELAPKGFTVLAVNASNEKLERIQNLVNYQGLTMPVFGQYTGVAKSAYKINAIPTLYFIDRKGTIKDAYVGGLTHEELLARCNAIL